jgi:hypothetical protein
MLLAKNCHNSFYEILFEKGELPMQIKYAIFVGAVAALASLTTPVLAKNSDAQKSDDKSTSSACHAYETAADGSSIQLPCEELGPKEPTQHKSATRSTDQEAH